MSTPQTIPGIILQQLGGSKFIAMTGVKCYSDGYYTLVVKFKGSRKANFMKIKLNSLDLYDIVISKVTGKYDVHIIKEVEGAYCDMLRSIFEEVTGLRTSL